MSKFSIMEAFQDLQFVETESPIYEAAELKKVNFKFPKGSLKIGDKIKYGSKIYIIIDLDWNDKFGYDIKINKATSQDSLGRWIGNGEHNVELVQETLQESAFSVVDAEEAKQALAMLHTEPQENVEMVVDLDANSKEELKFSYVGNLVLECPTCHTLVYKKPDDIEELPKEGSEELIDINEKCPHCGSIEGFQLVGQVMPIATTANGEVASEDEALPAETSEKPEEEIEVKEETKEEVKEEIPEEAVEEPTENVEPSVRESLKEDIVNVTIDSLDEQVFDTLVTNYLHETYDNVKSYKTLGGSVNDAENKVTLNGIIEFNSGKQLNSSFIFEAKEITKRGFIRMYGLNEALSKSKSAFMLTGKLVENKFVCESLTYNYKGKDSATNETKKVYGRVTVK